MSNQKIKFIIATICLYFFNGFLAFAENYLCEVKESGGLYYNEKNKSWSSSSFTIQKYTRQFSITKVTKSDYKDSTFEMFDRINQPYTAELMQPKYKVKTIYRSVSNVFKVCKNDFNEYGYLSCADGELLFNKNNMRFQRYYMGSFIHGCDLENEKCQTPKVVMGSCSKL